jgi:selenobiotic family peptide radical SAM maturase
MLRDGRLFGRRASSFTLQWHLTNACELSCRHCYDRSQLDCLDLAQAERVLDQLLDFCRAQGVKPQVCLTGGNPFLYPHFLPLYRRIAETACRISILGNPVPEDRLQEIVTLRRPIYYQVSLEGRRDTNDRVRGVGHFQRVLDFLPVLRRLKVPSHVMFTLHQENMNELIPLALELRGQVDHFTFNRLSQVGQGSDLVLPSKDEYVDLMKRYLQAAVGNPHMAFKDGLFNIARQHFRRPLTRGCTGFGCGAAFNFVALLPDGQVHACRKFPSPIGHVLQSSLRDIYMSPLARRYRQGSRACRFCRLRNLCGGCLAVTHGAGLPALQARDPHCFMRERRRMLAGFVTYPPQPPQPPPQPPPPQDELPQDELPQLLPQEPPAS